MLITQDLDIQPELRCDDFISKLSARNLARGTRARLRYWFDSVAYLISGVNILCASFLRLLNRGQFSDWDIHLKVMNKQECDTELYVRQVFLFMQIGSLNVSPSIAFEVVVTNGN